MTPIIEDSVLEDHLDCQNFDLRNVGQLFPVPVGLVGTNDPALSDARMLLDGSVTDFHVNAEAGIAQSKLSFDGAPPPEWIGGGDNQMAAGDLVERIANKGVPGGYAGLDANGQLSPSNVGAGTEIGTVTEVLFSFPEQFDVELANALSQSTIPTSIAGIQGWWRADVFSAEQFDPAKFISTVMWKDAPPGSWFGVYGIGLMAVLRPSFQVGTFPPELIPSLDAAKFTTGVFPPEVIPVANGSISGAVPHPGGIGLPTDYLGRDMEWHTTAPDVIGMPRAPIPVITLDSWSEKEVIVTVRSTLPDSSLFTLVQKYPNYDSPGFSLVKLKHDNDPDVHTTLTVHDKDIVWAYAAKAGYNNSGFATGCPGAGHTNPLIVITPLSTFPYPDPCP